jgi:membrane protease YdiL (CAAX protease family)
MASENFVLQEFGRSLERWGFMDVLLPFLLIFTLIFAVLEKSKILGEEKRNFNTAIALIFGLIIVIPHITGDLPAGFDPVLIINAALPQVGLVVVGIISLMILIGVFGHEKMYLGMSMPGWVAFFSIVAVVIIFGSAAEWYASGFDDWLENVFGSDALAIFIMIVVFGVIIAFVTGGESEREKLGGFKRLGMDFGKLFNK